MNLSIATLRRIISSAVFGIPFARVIVTDHGHRVVSVAIPSDHDDGVVVNLDYALRTGKLKGATWSRELFVEGESKGLFPVNLPDLDEQEIEALKLRVMFVRRTIKQAIKAEGYWSTRVSRSMTMEEWSRPVVVTPPATAVVPPPAFPNAAAIDPLVTIANQLAGAANALIEYARNRQ